MSVLPKATHFYDLFCGGGSVSHAALLSGKYKHIHMSDIDDVVLLVKDVFDDNIPDGSEWISREDFYARKDSEPWIRVLWSWSSNSRDYIYSRELEPYKKAVHEMIYAATPNERRLKFKKVCQLMYQLLVADNQQNTPPLERHITTRAGLPETLQRVQHMERFTPPKKFRIFSDLQHQERVLRCSKATNDTTETWRFCQCGPFYMESMTAESVITERLKYSPIQ